MKIIIRIVKTKGLLIDCLFPIKNRSLEHISLKSINSYRNDNDNMTLNL